MFIISVYSNALTVFITYYSGFITSIGTLHADKVRFQQNHLRLPYSSLLETDK
jgi:hypothetical protein